MAAHKYDTVGVGAGFSGSVIAERLSAAGELASQRDGPPAGGSSVAVGHPSDG
jgi:hypothetical protein